ncbi:PREDICTED: uncharacterized protein LOC109191567 [Ipomoea nil]|uniref:uncharacterized protein LOC109191567 n=1 Tax=Ipomoea nil TaxID=35883 RepID=UPI00090103FB|nr:PREDICTED: uncharacterized protein LOC109191567 [Ipomoea nil]
MTRDAIVTNPTVEVRMKLIGKCSQDAKTYNLSTVSEVIAIIVGDLDPSLDGYREDISFNVEKNIDTGARHSISLHEYLSFRIHERFTEISTFLYAKRLFQQFLVDGYTMVESGRLLYIRTHQQSLHCGSYRGLFDALTCGEIEPGTQGRRIVLPFSFTGGARYMVQNYQDAMAICAWIGYPNIFITFTFIYTVEFQKRGLPHAHILLFIDRVDVITFSNDIDSIISAEIPSKDNDLEYYTVVGEFMIHDPCSVANNKSPCMVKGRCSKHFPKKFMESSVVDCNGYPIYRCRDDGHTILKSGVELDNRFVVPHNRYLLLKYRAHINVEWCNQSRSIKYLFKYVNKGNDRVTAQFYKSSNSEDIGEVIDEIGMYYDCRYISPCQAVWRLFSYDIQFRNPSVERLSFHLPNEQSIVFYDDLFVETVLERTTIKNSMFLAWFEANKRYPKARELTYREMHNCFVWKRKEREWQPRRRGFAIGRMFYVPPGIGEIFYRRCLLNLVRGPISFEEIHTIDGIQYSSFRDACYARGLICDEKEYIDAIVEASHWSTASALRRLFVTLLTSNSLCKPEKVWDVVWPHLCDDVEYNH